LVSAQGLAESLKLLLDIIQVLEGNVSFLNLNPKCEPQLGRRGLYRQTGGAKDATLDEIALLWVLNLSDGQHNLLDIALRSGITFHRVTAAADALREAGLLAPA
jgi:aminopeptidase-like protein